MRLFFTGSDFILNGVSLPQIPFLCDQEMELVSIPNEYLRYIAMVKGRTRSRETWRTYGNHLYEYFSFLEANTLSWDSIDQACIAAWRDAMLERECARSTVNQRLCGVHAFYKWAAGHGKIHSIPFNTQDIWVAPPPGFLAHVDASGGRFNANELTIRTYKPMPKFLHINQAIQFLEAMSPHLLKVMGYLALLTGMRRDEILRLDYRVTPNPAGHDPDKQLPMVLDANVTKTKGNKTRTVMLPYDLAVVLWNYFCRDWPKRNALHKRQHGHESTKFFLSQYGEEFSVRYLNNAFLKVKQKAGIKCTPHMLRHTFATYELCRMGEKLGQSKALLWVRDRMGHSSIQTTEIYIHAADLVKNDDVDGYQAELCEALRLGN